MGTRDSERGNVFYIILIGIVLFAALMFTFSRGVRQGTGNLDKLQIELAASDILSYAGKVERAVSKILAKPYSEDQINFVGAQDFGGAYSNAKCTVNDCRVFDPAGGSLGLQPPQPDWFDTTHTALAYYGRYLFTARYCVAGVGPGACAGSTGSDLVMILPALRQEVCAELNQRLAVTGIPAPASPSFSYATTVKFNGTYPSTGGPTNVTHANIDNRKAFCMQDTGVGKFDFYYVLIAR